MNNLDKEYSPSLWNRRFSNGNEVIEFHKRFVSQESDRVRELFKFETIYYGRKNNENFDIYGVDLPSDSPIVVYVHGGYWQELNKTVSAYCVDPLVSNGIKVIVVDFDNCPMVTLSELIEQFTKCGEFILNYAERIGCRQLSWCGHSAGAHLILCMINNLLRDVLKPIRIHALYLISGIYDLTELQHTVINEANILSVDADNVNELSPLMFDFEKFFMQTFSIKIYVAEYDSSKFIEQSNKLYKRLQDAKLMVNVRLLEKHDHFNIVENLSDKSSEIIQEILSSI